MLRIVGGSERPKSRRFAIVIPARFASTRFPGKPLAPLRGARGDAKPLIQRSWEAACRAASHDDVWIATDEARIAEAASNFGAQVVLTSAECRNGTERCWHAVASAGIEAQLIINLQGDAPLTPPLAIEALVDTMLEAPAIHVATPMIRCSTMLADRLMAEDRAGRVGGTTVVFDRGMNALYFSKRVIPRVPERTAQPPVFLHVGLYGYRREALQEYARLAPSPLEELEGLEQLRFLHAGIPIRMVEIGDPPGGIWEVNNPGDLVTVEAALAQRHID